MHTGMYFNKFVWYVLYIGNCLSRLQIVLNETRDKVRQTNQNVSIVLFIFVEILP